MPCVRPLNLVLDVSLGPVLFCALARRAASWAGLSGVLLIVVRGIVRVPRESNLGCSERRAGVRAGSPNLSRLHNSMHRKMETVCEFAFSFSGYPVYHP